MALYEHKKSSRFSRESLKIAMHKESLEFEKHYDWLDKHMSDAFFEEFDTQKLMTITHNLMSFQTQGLFVQINFDTCSIVMCLDSPDADLRILENFASYGIKNYQTFISNEPPLGIKTKKKLRIAVLYFTGFKELNDKEFSLPDETKQEIYQTLLEKNKDLTSQEFENVLSAIHNRFLRVLTKERLITSLDVFLKAKTRNHIQYQVKYNENWKESPKELPSMQIVFAWRNTQKFNFLYRVAKVIFRHKLMMKRVNAAYIETANHENILLMSLAIHGQENKAAWESTDVKDFLQELAILKYFEDDDVIEEVFVQTNMIRGNLANWLRCMVSLAHQLLLHQDPYLYAFNNIQEALIRHPELTVKIAALFESKFKPDTHNLDIYRDERAGVSKLIDKLDTGNLIMDNRRKTVLKMMLSLIESMEKTNFYVDNKSALAFRFSPEVMNALPYDRTQKFPELPFALFYIQGKSFFGFHIRFKDISRGGVRTVIFQKEEQALWERQNVFSECYNLAYTQQKKNKDIPEGGSKAVIFIDIVNELASERAVYERELAFQEVREDDKLKAINTFIRDQRLIALYQSQRSFIHSLLALINIDESCHLRNKDIIDYYQKPEYLYLGPDENMSNEMIEWIANYSKECGYPLQKAFITSKVKGGINHKDYGVTSLGVHTYLERMLAYIGIDPKKDPFTVKMTGGPDGDVAGNEIYNLCHFYPETAKILAITDGSGTIYDPKGFDPNELITLFKQGKPIAAYNPDKLSDGSFLLDLYTKREETVYASQTLCYRKEGKKVTKQWLSGSETHHLFSHNVHQVVSDVFIPAGGRPRTLNQNNVKDFLDSNEKPTAKIIVEGANLYLTGEARTFLEKKGVLIIKDSSANKGGVICSSLEVLSNLVMTEEEFERDKNLLMPEILNFIKNKALSEANLLLQTRDQTGKMLTEISDIISQRINLYTYQILDYLTDKSLQDANIEPLTKCLLEYVPLFFKTRYKNRLRINIPPIHQKAIISCYIASELVYKKGLSWSPKIIDVLPLILEKDIGSIP